MNEAPLPTTVLLRGHLRRPGTYVLAVVVGTLINLYGHALLPLLHGDETPLVSLGAKLLEEPLVMGSSIAIAYVFPFLVGCVASVRAQRVFSCPRCREPNRQGG